MTYLLNNFNGNIAKPQTLVKVEKREHKLIFYFEAYNSSLYSYSKENNSELWRACVCEAFLDLGDDFYYEFEVAPNGANFVAKIKNREVEFFKQYFFNSTSKIIGDSYFVKMTIDLEKLGFCDKKIKYNCFRVEVKPNEKEQNLSALNPTLCETFHVKEKFIELL